MENKVTTNLKENTQEENTATAGMSQQGGQVPKSLAWISCDDCDKWRRIPGGLGSQNIKTGRRWICKANLDKTYADCSIPQEMSDAEIYAELGIVSESEEEDTSDFGSWIKCFNCGKWRRSPGDLGDQIMDAEWSWICKDNLDKTYGDCSIPQEMSNADISAELGHPLESESESEL